MPVGQDAWVLIMRSQTSAVHGFNTVAHWQDNESVRSGLFTIAQFGREETRRVSRPRTTIIRFKEICTCKPRESIGPDTPDLFVEKPLRERRM